MYLTHPFTIFSALSFLPPAIPMAQSLTPHGIAIPIARRARDPGTVDPVKIANGVMNSVTKIQRGMGAYQSNTGTAHPLSDRIKTSDKRDASIPLYEDNNGEMFYGIISIGTPAVDYKVWMDTGSAELFVPDATCGKTCEGHTLYNAESSKTSSVIKETFKASYRDSALVVGNLHNDVVTIAGLSALQTFGSATTYPSQWSATSFPADGIVGLGFEVLSAYKATSFFETLANQGLLKHKVFSFKLTTSGNGDESVLYIGGYGPEYTKNDFTWVHLTEKSFWQAYFDSISVGNQHVLGPTHAVFDTGTTMIIGDPEGIAALYFHIDGHLVLKVGKTYNYYIPCSFNTPIFIVVGGKKIQILPDIFKQGYVDIPDHPDYCFGGAVGSTDLPIGGLWILGLVFLQNVFSAFDIEIGAIGIVPLFSI